MVTRHSTLDTRHSRRRGFAILMVVLVLVALAIIAAPFAISMRQEESTRASTSRHASAPRWPHRAR